MKKILLVEDDMSLGESLKSYLHGEFYEVLHTCTLEETRALSLSEHKVDLILLDWMLPDGQGLDYLRDIRAEGIDTPVIMLTARTELIDKVLGLETGANDYITKPFEPRELSSRIRVQLRMGSVQVVSPDIFLEVNGILLNNKTRTVTFNSQGVVLAKMEYELLKLFMSMPEKVFSREEILNKVWGYDNFPTTRTVDTHILQLRNKFYDELIETVRGVGYRLREKD